MYLTDQVVQLKDHNMNNKAKQMLAHTVMYAAVSIILFTIAAGMVFITSVAAGTLV